MDLAGGPQAARTRSVFEHGRSLAVPRYGESTAEVAMPRFNANRPPFAGDRHLECAVFIADGPSVRVQRTV
jgi:hypothetical protein